LSRLLDNVLSASTRRSHFKKSSRGQKCGSAVPLRVHNRAPNLSSVTNPLSALRFWLLMELTRLASKA